MSGGRPLPISLKWSERGNRLMVRAQRAQRVNVPLACAAFIG